MSHQQAARLQQVMALMCQAIASNGVGQAQQALLLLDQALALDPSFIPAHMQRGVVLEHGGRLESALAAYEACLVVAPAFHDARSARQRVLQALVADCQQRLLVAPNQATALFSLASALHQLRQLEPALPAARAALAAAPAPAATHYAARVLLADILLQLNRHDEALLCYAQSEVDVEHALLSSYNRADILRQMGRFDEALVLLEQVVAVRPGFAEAQVALAHLQLMRGDFAAGWQRHELRHQIAALAGRCPRPEISAWQPGQDIAGQHVLLWAEQGLGDSLQFVRYVGLVAARAAKVTVCLPVGLLALLAPAFPMCDFVADATNLPAHDVQAPLMSLPLLLGRPDPAAAPAPPYLHADAQRADHWRAQLEQALSPGQQPRLRVGLVWAGRQYAQVNHSRDIALAQLLPLFTLPCDFVALQPELPATDETTAAALEGAPGRLVRLPMGDWADTAALVAQLDLVIAVDTAVAHLAGAMGKPVWLLLRHEGEWRWGRDAHLTPWYGAMRLWRQAQPGHWDAPVAQVVLAMQELPDR